MLPPACLAVSRLIPGLRAVKVALWFAVALPGVAGATTHLACTPAGLAFGKVAVGQQKTLSATLSNDGSTAIKLASLQVDDQAFAVSGLSFPLVLKAGQGIAFNVAFAPTASRYNPGELLFKVASGSSLSVPINGQGVNGWSLTANPSSLAFGNVAVGNSSAQDFILTNAGTSAVTISRQSTPEEFAVSGPGLPFSLGAGQSAKFQVTFTPKWRGTVENKFSVTNTDEPIFSVPLSGTGGGTGSARLTLNPATLSFGSVDVGATGTQAGTLTAKGGSVTISAASFGSALFSLNGITLPLTLGAGQSASFEVIFAPQAGGNVSSAVSFTSNATDSPTVAALSGTGVEPAFSVNLSWHASTSQVAGYNIYRSSALNGTYSRLNPALDPGTAFTDSTVASGATYYYDVTSVNSVGEESSPCSPVKVTVN
jgi:Abnormal spindle-like microcephaly-assoc'd, ASPM-SPD-2-Hydin